MNVTKNAGSVISPFATEIIRRIELPPEAAEIAVSAADVIGAARAENLIVDFFDKGNNDAPERLVAEVTAEGNNSGEIGLATAILLAEGSYRKVYTAKSDPPGLDHAAGVSDDIFFDTMSDITVWSKTYLRNNDRWGFGMFGWMEGHFRGRLHKIGRLQFVPNPFENDEYTCGGETRRRGDRVIYIHIPERGPLLPELCLDSLKKAYAFYGGKEKVFVTGSWLLYPAHREFLPPSSNILTFMDMFTILHSSEKEGTGDMWRIFGSRADFTHPETLERTTSLQRAYADWYAKIGKTGSAYGVIVFDGEKIVRE